jgi:hypothetical protein
MVLHLRRFLFMRWEESACQALMGDRYEYTDAVGRIRRFADSALFLYTAENCRIIYGNIF